MDKLRPVLVSPVAITTTNPSSSPSHLSAVPSSPLSTESSPLSASACAGSHQTDAEALFQSQDSEISADDLLGKPTFDKVTEPPQIPDLGEVDASVFGNSDLDLHESLSLPFFFTSLPLGLVSVFPPTECHYITLLMLVVMRPVAANRGPAVREMYFIKPEFQANYGAKLQRVLIAPFYSLEENKFNFYAIPILPGKPAWTERAGILKSFIGRSDVAVRMHKHTPNGKVFWDWKRDVDTSHLDWNLDFKNELARTLKRQDLIRG